VTHKRKINATKKGKDLHVGETARKVCEGTVPFVGQKEQIDRKDEQEGDQLLERKASKIT